MCILVVIKYCVQEVPNIKYIRLCTKVPNIMYMGTTMPYVRQMGILGQISGGCRLTSDLGLIDVSVQLYYSTWEKEPRTQLGFK